MVRNWVIMDINAKLDECDWYHVKERWLKTWHCNLQLKFQLVGKKLNDIAVTNFADATAIDV